MALLIRTTPPSPDDRSLDEKVLLRTTRFKVRSFFLMNGAAFYQARNFQSEAGSRADSSQRRPGKQYLPEKRGCERHLFLRLPTFSKLNCIYDGAC